MRKNLRTSLLNKLAILLVCVLALSTQTGCKRKGGSEEAQSPARIEKARETAPQSAEGITHIVAEGETLWKLKDIYGISIPALKKYNSANETSALKKGSRIFVPGSPKVLNARRDMYFKNADKSKKVKKDEKKFDWPVRGSLISKFSSESKGIFIRVKQNSPVKAVSSGEIVFSGPMKGYGNLIIVDHLDGVFTIYGNNVKNLVKKGDNVKAGQKIAVGGEKSQEGCRTYFEIRLMNGEKGEPESVDPMKYLKEDVSEEE